MVVLSCFMTRHEFCLPTTRPSYGNSAWCFQANVLRMPSDSLMFEKG